VTPADDGIHATEGDTDAACARKPEQRYTALHHWDADRRAGELRQFENDLKPADHRGTWCGGDHCGTEWGGDHRGSDRGDHRGAEREGHR
jgi:hypothetical protein